MAFGSGCMTVRQEVDPLFAREDRAIRLGYGLMALITVLALASALASHLWVRLAGACLDLALGWWLYLARTRTRLELARQTLTDPLTGLYNRRYLFPRLQEELHRTDRYGGTLTLAVIDLDDFKAFNDRHGHVSGDKVLQWVAAALRTNLRRSDLAFRYGGEEFVLVFPQTTADEALRVLQRAAEQLSFIRFSGGLAEYPTEATSAESAFELADRRLLQAKRQGKGCVLSARGTVYG